MSGAPSVNDPITIAFIAELANVSARVTAATAGPWRARRAERPALSDPATAGDVGILSDALPHVPGVSNPIVGEVFAERTRGLYEVGQAMRDAEFICHAREDVPTLLSLVTYYRAALAKIAKQEGRFVRDPCEHARNCVEDMAHVAEGALAGTWENEEVPA
jgi:hypothetical protein